MNTSRGITLAEMSVVIGRAGFTSADGFRRRYAPFFFAWLGHRPTDEVVRTPHDTQRYERAATVSTQASTSTTRAPHPEQLPRTSSSLTELVVFPVVRSIKSVHAFVSVGRLEGNDIALGVDTVSKFHAYLKADASGAYTLLQDGRSENGTFVDEQPVAPRGHG